MDIDRSKIPSKKVYEKHSKGVIWSGLLTFLVVGFVAAFFLLPLVAYFPNGGERVDMTGFNLVCYAFRSFLKGFYNSQFDRFSQSVSSYSGQTALFFFLSSNFSAIEIVVISFLLIAVIFTLIVFTYGLVFLIRGHIKYTLMVSSIAHSVVTFLGLFVGLLFLYFLLCRKMFIECNILDHIRFFITPFLLLIGILTVAIILSVIYNKCFRKRVYILDYKLKPEDDPAYKNSSIHKYLKNFPNGTHQIADDAFKGNEEIVDIIIPEGITRLGQCTFINCINLETVSLPKTLEEIGADCFYNTPKLKGFVFKGTMEEWNKMYRGHNWMYLSGAETVETSDGKLVLK